MASQWRSSAAERVPPAMSRKVAAARFLDVAFSKGGPISRSYTDRDRNWLIRGDLLALLREFPSLSLSSTAFPPTPTTPAVNLLTASGTLPVPSSLFITIILHPGHPLFPPSVYVTSPSGAPILHPFVNPDTCAATTPCIVAWKHPKSNLADLVRNLVNIFGLAAQPAPAAPSRREAIDRISMQLLSDLATFNAAMTEEEEALKLVKSILSGRATALKETVEDLEREEAALKGQLEETTKSAAAVEEWLRLCTDTRQGLDDEDIGADVFEGANEQSERKLQVGAECLAIDDAMKMLDKALEEDVLCLGEYLRMVRSMAREQFFVVQRSKEIEKEEAAAQPPPDGDEDDDGLGSPHGSRSG